MYIFSKKFITEQPYHYRLWAFRQTDRHATEQIEKGNYDLKNRSAAFCISNLSKYKIRNQKSI